MSRRRLTEQQQRRIASRQESRDEQTGVVVARFARNAEVRPDSAPDSRLQCHIRATVKDLVVGDRVQWLDEKPRPVITARLERQSALLRDDGHGHRKTMAANIDSILIVIAPSPQPHTNLIDRYLAAAEFLEIDATIVINKADLPGMDELANLQAHYRNIGYDVIPASAITGQGISDILHQLRNHTAIVVGQSGVGKSSLVNALIPGESATTGALSNAADKGTHTTTTARLYQLPNGGHLIDSPGIREFMLNYIPPEQLARCFRELLPWTQQCRFRNCTHQQEPDCAVRDALANDRLSPARIASYNAILNEMQAQAKH